MQRLHHSPNPNTSFLLPRQFPHTLTSPLLHIIAEIHLHTSLAPIWSADESAARHCYLLDTPHCCDSGVCPTIGPARPHLAFDFCPASPDGLAELHHPQLIRNHTYIGRIEYTARPPATTRTLSHPSHSSSPLHPPIYPAVSNLPLRPPRK